MKKVTEDEMKLFPKPIEFYENDDLEEQRELKFDSKYKTIDISDTYVIYESLNLEDIPAKDFSIFFRDLSNYYKYLVKKEKESRRK